MTPAQEFTIRIKHWRDHNEEHKKSLEEWSGKIRDAGFADASDALDRAAVLMADSVAELDKALKTLE